MLNVGLETILKFARCKQNHSMVAWKVFNEHCGHCMNTVHAVPTLCNRVVIFSMLKLLAGYLGFTLYLLAWLAIFSLPTSPKNTFRGKIYLLHDSLCCTTACRY
jgi:hypothetical protein